MTNLLLVIVAAIVLVAFVLHLRHVPYGYWIVSICMATYVCWPLLRFLTSGYGVLFIAGCAFGPFAYQAHVAKREEAMAEARRRRVLREQYRELGL